MSDAIDDDAVLAAHRQLVRELAAPGGPLAARGPNATVSNPAWFTGDPPIALAARRRLHTRLIEETRAKCPDVEQGRRAIVLAGPPGAGKTTVLNTVLGEQKNRWLVVDPDEFKKSLLNVAIADGSFATHIKPAQVHALEAAGERFAPLELASLVHAESSILAERLRTEAIETGTNVVIDSVLSHRESALALGEQLHAAGYAVTVIDVETTYDISASRVEQRWRDVTRAYLDGQKDAELGGRWVPSEYARGLYPPELHGRSVSEGIARELATTCPAVTRYEVHRVTHPTADPVLETVSDRAVAGYGPVVPSTRAASFPTSPGRAGATAEQRPRTAGARAPGRDSGVER